MNGRELFQIWAPLGARQWTKFAKPSLFAQLDRLTPHPAPHLLKVPSEVLALINEKTALIIDLPGASSVESGLAAAKIGFRPVPFYNGIHEEQAGSPIVDNAAIIEALLAGAATLSQLELPEDAPPAFLLDSQREKDAAVLDGMFDNRYQLDVDDFPSASYLKQRNILRLVIWSDGQLREDLIPLKESYEGEGIQVLVVGGEAVLDTAVQEETSWTHIQSYINGRNTLGFIALLASLNLFGMFFVNEEPLLWTSPSIMWLTYLWVSEGVGDLLAILSVALYWIFYLGARHKRSFYLLGSLFFAVDTLVFYLYANFYGWAAFTDDSFGYGLVAFGLPLLCGWFLFQGYRTLKHLKSDDGLAYSGNVRHHSTRIRSHRPYRGSTARGYRGYGGYGGSGKGGYKGSGYSGRSSSSGGFGG